MQCILIYIYHPWVWEKKYLYHADGKFDYDFFSTQNLVYNTNIKDPKIYKNESVDLVCDYFFICKFPKRI